MTTEGVPASETGAGDSLTLTLRLEGFEGPLDLLLHLIKREEIDIWNIPIAQITEQYLQYLQVMKDLNINLAGEWLVMAATLIYIKSRMLLPPDPAGGAQEELVEDREVMEEAREVVAVTLFGLLRAFHEIVKRFEERHVLQVDQEEISIEEKIADIRRLLLVRDTILFSSFFTEAPAKQHLIATFLAILELVRLREIWLYQKANFQEIHISKGKASGETA